MTFLLSYPIERYFTWVVIRQRENSQLQNTNKRDGRTGIVGRAWLGLI
jgi:hypothetical protein